jgi:hypothetical protein
MNDLVLPILIAEGLDISIFQSIETALQALEPWWVEEKLGSVYDAQGRHITLKAENHRVGILMWEAEPTHAGELTSLLRDFLKFSNNPSGIDLNCDLPCLITECRKILKN